jgi:itaconyl-CoA hydratase
MSAYDPKRTSATRQHELRTRNRGMVNVDVLARGGKGMSRRPFINAPHDGREKMGTVKQGWVGRFFEDFTEGDIYRSRIGRTITEADNIQFTLLTNNTNQIHFNAHYASRTEFKRPLVNSALTLSVVAGLGVVDVSENGFALGWDYIKLPNPVFPGDTLYSESEVISTRESKSRPEQGVVKIRTRGMNQNGQVVIEYERSVMVWKRSHAPLIALFPEPKDGAGRS